MLFLIKNRILTENRESTQLTAAIAAGATVLTLKAIDSNAWADNDWILVGEIGSPNAEILQINGAVSSGTSLTVENAGGGARFAHSVDEPVYRLDYNQAKFYRNATDNFTGAALLATKNLQMDDFETRYDDTANTTGFGFVRFFNSETSALSPVSDGMPYAGQERKSLGEMIKKIRTLVDEQDSNFLTDDEITDAINDLQRDIIDERLWTFDEIELSLSSVADQFIYDKPSLIKTLHTVRFDTEPVAYMSQAKWELLHWDSDSQASCPFNFSVWANQFKFYPRPSDSANATTLDGNITDSDVDITVVLGTGFKRGDFYRFIIEDEVIYATTLSSAGVFGGCLRGQEGTTAASHLDTTAVTERDIVLTGQKVAVDLSELNDETVVPESIVICHGVAVDFCYGKLDKETLGDRYEVKYDKGMKKLRERYSKKLTSQFGVVKDPREVINDNSVRRNPNDYPSDVVAT